MSADAKPYKETLNLPATRLDMKANLRQREPALQARWRERDLEAAIRRARAGRPRRVLHDGPPYANGAIHMGHLLNKVLKDLVVRYWTMRGFDSPYVPGWDCHGLPIEHKVVKDLGSKAAGLPQADLRRLCHDEAMKWVGLQRDQFRRLGIGGQWNKPYLTLDPRYEAGVLDVLADLVEQGFVTRQLKPIHWDVADRTALAEAELEYHDVTSPSVYVLFPMETGLPAAWGPGPWQALIWTTTPWTLPANVAIAAHPNLDYAAVRFVDPHEGGEAFAVMAAARVEAVMATREIAEFEVVGRAPGRALEHARYRHPLIDRTGPIVMADYVTADDGTGLVHTAPGHGADDYRTGRAYNLPILSPVDAAGRFTAEAPEPLVGKQVFDANPVVIDLLGAAGALYHHAPIRHSYPHGWRSKKPVIFRATPQWFVNVDHEALRERTLQAIDQVQWHPAWGRSRIDAMVQNRPDWCISRQRAWGVPIPALYDDRTGEPHLTAESVRHFRDLFRRDGADAWFNRPVAELVPPDLDTDRHPVEHLSKGTDILDVWFESGSSHRSVVREESYDCGPYPAALYLEGSDQHRGWFQSSILTAVGTTGRAPFEAVLTHGFVVDDKGEKMAKSGGNAVSAVDATEQYGADVLRLYVAGMDYADDVKMSERGIKEASESYRKIRNTFRFLLGNLGDYQGFDPDTFDPDTLEPIDRWALAQLNSVIRDVTGAFEAFEFYRAHQRLYQFCAVELSSLYLDVTKDRLYAEAPDGPGRRAAQFVLARLHETLARLFAPILPHTAEEVWDYLPASADRPDSVHLAHWPEPDPTWDEPEAAADWGRRLAVRSEILAALEGLRAAKTIGSALEASVCLEAESPELFAQLEADRGLLESLAIVSEVVVSPTATVESRPAESVPGLRIAASRSAHPKCDRCWNLRPTVGHDPDHPTICARCSRVVRGLGAR